METSRAASYVVTAIGIARAGFRLSAVDDPPISIRDLAEDGFDISCDSRHVPDNVQSLVSSRSVITPEDVRIPVPIEVPYAPDLPVRVQDLAEDDFIVPSGPRHVPDHVQTLVGPPSLVTPEDVRIRVPVEVPSPRNLPVRVQDLAENGFCVREVPFMYQMTFRPW